MSTSKGFILGLFVASASLVSVAARLGSGWFIKIVLILNGWPFKLLSIVHRGAECTFPNPKRAAELLDICPTYGGGEIEANLAAFAGWKSWEKQLALIGFDIWADNDGYVDLINMNSMMTGQVETCTEAQATNDECVRLKVDKVEWEALMGAGLRSLDLTIGLTDDEYNRFVDMFDKDGDGTLSSSELMDPFEQGCEAVSENMKPLCNFAVSAIEGVLQPMERDKLIQDLKTGGV